MSRPLRYILHSLKGVPSKLKIARPAIATDPESASSASSNVQFCEDCDNVRLDGEWAKELSHVIEITCRYSKSDTLPELPGFRQSAWNGCPLCEMLFQAINEQKWLEPAPRCDWRECGCETIDSPPRTDLVPPPFEGKLIVGSVLYTTRSEMKDYKVFLSAMSVKILIISNGVHRHYRLYFEISSSAGLCFRDGSDDTILNIHFSKPPFDDHLSPRALSTMQRWITACEESCHPFEHGVPLPTRLIDIGEHSSILPRLVTTSEGITDDKYATLSYCWGPEGTRRLETKKDTLIKHQRGISFESIPKTIADAILLTRALGLRYIWVDALCIVQNNKEDWETEASRMCDVYRHSYVTIVPLDSRSSDDGFLRRPHIPGTNIPFHSSQGPLKGKEYMVQSRTGDLPGVFPEKTIEESIWKSRGWTFQEEQLSRRILMFSTDRISFRCPNNMNTEMGVPPEPNKSPKFLNSVNSAEHFHGVYWELLVVNTYNKRQFTYLGDKLPALSGFARLIEEFPKYTHDRYIAGHWLSTLYHSLLWTPNWELIEQISPSEAMSRASARPSPYIAPTWSWASFLEPTDITEAWGEPAMKILEAETLLDGNDPFGRITDGWLVLRGQYLSLEKLFRHSKASLLRAYPETKSRYQWDIIWNDYRICICWPDWGKKSENWDEYDVHDHEYLRRLTLFRVQIGKMHTGLMLLHLEAEGVWVRMGTFSEKLRDGNPGHHLRLQQVCPEWSTFWKSGDFKII